MQKFTSYLPVDKKDQKEKNLHLSYKRNFKKDDKLGKMVFTCTFWNHSNKNQIFSPTLNTGHPEGMFSYKIFWD